MDRRYRAVYAKLLLEHMKRGLSLESFAALETKQKRPVPPATVTSWVKRHADFAQAYEEGKAAALLFFERRLLNAAQNDKSDLRSLLAMYRSRRADMTKETKELSRGAEKPPTPKQTLRPAVIGQA